MNKVFILTDKNGTPITPLQISIDREYLWQCAVSWYSRISPRYFNTFDELEAAMVSDGYQIRAGRVEVDEEDA